MFELVFTTGPLSGKRVQISVETVIGRQDSDVTIDDPEVSRRHAAVRPTTEGIEIEDLGSLNGTLVNNLPIKTPTPLSAGDVIELGNTTIEVAGELESDRTVVRKAPAGEPVEQRTVQQAAPAVEQPAAQPPAAAPPTVPQPAAQPPAAFQEPLPPPGVQAPEPAAAPFGAQPAPMAPPPSVPGAQITHLGHRYVLGFTADAYGIWDRTQPSVPVQRFARDDAGWGAAWQTFTSWEPDAVDAPAQAAAPVAGPLATAPTGQIQLPPGIQLATPGKRLGSALLDALLAVVTLYIGWIIWSVVIWKDGQSPAKRILGLRVLKIQTGRKATRGEMALRELVGKLLLGFIPFWGLIGAIFVLTDPKRQALWDKIAGTVVVDDPNNQLA